MQFFKQYKPVMTAGTINIKEFIIFIYFHTYNITIGLKYSIKIAWYIRGEWRL